MPVAITGRDRSWPLAIASIAALTALTWVITRCLAAAVVEVVLQDDLLGFVRQALPGTVAGQSVAGDGKDWRSRLVSRAPSARVRSCKTKPSPLEENMKGISRVSAYLSAYWTPTPTVMLLSSPRSPPAGVRFEIEDVVGAFGLAAADQLTAHDDAAPGGHFLADLR